MKQEETLKIYTNELKPDETLIYLFARAIDDEIKAFYKNPQNEAAFEEWKAKRERNGND